MDSTKRATYLAAIASVIIGPLALYYIFDVTFVNRSETTRKGLRFETLEESDNFRRSLDAQGISYNVKTAENGVEIWWSIEEDKKRNQTAPVN